jgi:hypothetical protein
MCAVWWLRPVRPACTAAAACGYGTGVGVSAAAAAAGAVHGFPAELTSFIGRAGLAREVAGLLEEHRLVTVTGPGGVGKTRLAGEVARAVAGRFADGAWLAELAPLGDPARVAGVVAVALGVREQPGVPVAEVLVRVLGRRPRSCARGCWRPVMMSGCWRPAGSPCTWRARRGTGWGR